MKKFLLLFLSLSLSLYACDQNLPMEDRSLIYKELKKKQDNFRKTELSNCKENAILQAEIYVDSIIYDIKRFSVLEDSLEMILKPSRPKRPEYIKIKDTGPIVPFKEKKKLKQK